MRAVDIIAKKRDGLSLSADEIQFFVQGFTRGDIPEYQASAWTMAILLRGMNRAETAALTMAMASSGHILDLSGVAPTVVDKHSSGGVGDKTTLIVAPLVASCGVPVGKMSGRGLAHTGGTLDKLESIPGFRVDLSESEFVTQLRNHRIVVSGQTHELAPADGKLYALRDVTATVDSIPLIASSIMSKKIASGAGAIVLDVKVGLGAFMKTEAEAVDLAELMVGIGQDIGRKVSAVISDMNQPLGCAVGNAVEVAESVRTLQGRGPGDLLEHCLAVSARMLMLANAAPDEASAYRRLKVALDSGSALAKFREWVQAQGGDDRVAEDLTVLPQAKAVEPFRSPSAGYLQKIDAFKVGLASMHLGGGRERKGDPIDYAVGVVLEKKIGDAVSEGEPIALIHAETLEQLEEARSELGNAIEVGPEPPAPLAVIHRII